MGRGSRGNRGGSIGAALSVEQGILHRVSQAASRQREARMTVQQSNQRMATAYHEAGHAVASWRLGVSLRRRGVTIIPAGDALGSASHHQVVGRDIEWDGSDGNRLKVERYVQICLAGRIAQKKYDPRSVRRYHSRRDDQQAVDMLFRMTCSTREVEVWLKLLEIRTEGLFSNPDVWCAVQRLAEALIQRGKLSGRDATEVMRTGFDEGFDAAYGCTPNTPAPAVATQDVRQLPPRGIEPSSLLPSTR